MLTRRQARLLGLTTGEEGSPMVHSNSEASASPAFGSDPASVNTANASTATVDTNMRDVSTSSPRTAIVLRLSASASHGSSHDVQLSSSSHPTPLLAALVDNGSNRSGAQSGRGRLGIRQAESMVAAAQRVMDYWSAAGTTAGPLIQLASPYASHRPGYGLVSDAAPRSYSRGGGGRNGSVAVAASTEHRPSRLSATQLRARWRGVMRNCTTLQPSARNSRPAGASSSPPPPPLSSSPPAHGRHAAEWPDGEAVATSHTPHVLQLACSADPSTAEGPQQAGKGWRVEVDGGEGGPTRSVVQARGAHRDRTASPEASSRRCATYFHPPFYSDAPPPPSSSCRAALLHPPSNLTSKCSPSPSASSAVAQRPCKSITALALQQHTLSHVAAQQRRLSHEVHFQMCVKAHEARMRMLFGLGDMEKSETTGLNASTGCDDQRGINGGGVEDASGAYDAVGAGEAAYLQSLDPSKSEGEAKVLQVIASIDAALKQQLASAYQHSVKTNMASDRAGRHALPHEGFRTRKSDSVNATSSFTNMPSTSNVDQPSIGSFASRRPAILEAVISSTTQRVEAFVNQLLPYQQEGVRWLLRLNSLEHMNGILADDMGLGKTAQTVVYLSCYKEMVEEEVQRPLEVLRGRHTQLCQRALGLAATGGIEAAAAAVERELLPPWLAWCVAAAGEEEDAEGVQRDVGSDTSARHAAPAAPLLKEAHSLGRTIQLVKEIKRWIWQLDEDSVKAEEMTTTQKGSSHRGPSSSPSSSSPLSSTSRLPEQPLQSPSELEAVDGEFDDPFAAAPPSPPPSTPAVNVISLLSVKRRRGRPPKHLSAMMAAAAAAAASSPAQSSSSRSSLTSSPAPPLPRTPCLSLSALVASQSQLSTCSATLDHRLSHDYTAFRPVLILAPLSTLPHWAGEFHRFTRRSADSGSGGGGLDAQDRFTVYVLNGSRTEREERMREFLTRVQSVETPATAAEAATGRPRRPTPVLVIPHDMLTKPLTGALRHITRVRWHVVVIDEAQRIKSAQSALYKRVRLLLSVSRLVLTGTPLQNNTTELFSLLQFLAPRSFASSSSHLFEQLDSALIAASRSTALEDRELHILLCRRVHRLLMPFILRREKTILKKALPPIRDYAVLCPLLPFQETQLEEVKRKHQDGTLSGNPHIQYRKILLHPYTTQNFFYVDEEVVQRSGKLLVLDFMMRFLQRTRHKFLIFCGWTLMLDVVETLCGMREIPYVRLDGRTSVEKREANIEGFNRPIADVGDNRESQASRRRRRRASGADGVVGGSDAGEERHEQDAEEEEEEERDVAPAPCCFLISKVAGGVGLNLQAADTVFLLDVDYNPQRDAQALSRVYRVGQTREVRVFRLVVDHPIERDTVAIHEAKENLSRAVVQAGRYDLHSSVQEREEALQQIFRAGTLSQLSQQWTVDSPATSATAEASTPTTNAEEEQLEGETSEVRQDFPPAPPSHGSHQGQSIGTHAFLSATSSPVTPTGLHRMCLKVEEPGPAALKRLKTEVLGEVKGEQEEEKGVPGLSEAVRLPPGPRPHVHARRQRRHISFKLEGEGGEGSKDSSTSSSHTEGVGADLSVQSDATPSLQTKTFLSAVDGEGASKNIMANVAVSPAEHLLAMRDRLEEVLLRHDGERGVLQEMYRSLEASVRAVR